jgi:CarD family transcriptional regulator, regulator of rRNA transcription
VDFQVGEKVIYPNQGIGVVEGIQARSTPEGQVDGYDLRILANDSRVWIPCASAVAIGLRAIMTLADAQTLLGRLADGTIDQSGNWKGRFKENSDRMRTGDVFEVAEVLKGLTSLSQKKALSFREKRMLDRAKFLIVSEMAEAEGRPEAAVQESVDQALKKAFSPKPKPARPAPDAPSRPANA